jgi:hypothetical protein
MLADFKTNYLYLSPERLQKPAGFGRMFCVIFALPATKPSRTSNGHARLKTLNDNNL